MTREEKLQKAHQMFDNRNLLTELKWQREYFRRGYISNQEELFNLWIFDECIKVLEQKPCCNCIEFKKYAKEMGFEIEQEPIIDKIKAEIIEKFGESDCAEECGCLYELLDIIDKYRAESEEKE